MVPILKNAFNFQPGNQNVCFPVSFPHSCLEYTVGLDQSKVILPSVHIPKIWGARQLLWDGSSDSISKWLHSCYVRTAEARGPHVSAHPPTVWGQQGCSSVERFQVPHKEVGTLWLFCSLLPVGIDLSPATHILNYGSIESKHLEKAEALLYCQSQLLPSGSAQLWKPSSWPQRKVDTH